MKRWVGLITGLLFAAFPAMAMATEASGRELDTPADMGTVLVVVVLTLLAMALVGGIGYLYRRERGLDWDFQKPDAPDHH